MEQAARSGRNNRTERIEIRGTVEEKRLLTGVMEANKISSQADAIFYALRELRNSEGLNDLADKITQELFTVRFDNIRIKRETGQTRDYLDGKENALEWLLAEMWKIKNPDL